MTQGISEIDKSIAELSQKYSINKEVFMLAKELYADLPYHNFEHALETMNYGYDLIERCKNYNISVDEQVVGYALLFHDAGYHKDQEAKGFETKEAYATSLAEGAMNSLGIDESLIKKTNKSIMATFYKNDPESVEEKIVRAADLRGLMGSYENFKKNSLKLKKEKEFLTGKEQSQKAWVGEVKKIISHYLSQDIKLTPEHDQDGMSEFHTNAENNLKKFLQEYTR